MDFFWRYFLALEEDLDHLSKYIELNQSNYKTYSIELARIYLSVCSEIDVLAKQLSNNLGSQNAGNINDYRKAILGNYKNFPSLQIKIPKYQLTFVPWSSWSDTPPSNPEWWTSYNNVKHQRDSHYAAANLENVLNAMAGLIIVNLYYICQQSTMSISLTIEMRPKLFVPDGFHLINLISGFLGWGGDIP